MKVEKVCVLGGTGFVGRHLVYHLAAGGKQVKVLARQPQRHRSLQVTPGVRLVKADMHDPEVLTKHFQDVDGVINLVGILNEYPRKELTFRKIHVDLAKQVMAACRETGVGRLLHMSALNANAEHGASAYLRTKGEAENHVHTLGEPDVGVTSFQPSVIFGPDDSFFNRFAGLLRLAPYFFPLACGGTRFAPVYVGDVARAFVTALDDKTTYGKRYALCGPRVFTLKELVEYTAKVLGLRRRVIGLSDGLSRLQARSLEFAPGKPFSYDNYLSLQSDSVCREDGLKALGIPATDVDEVVPLSLGKRAARLRYTQYRQEARRDFERTKSS